MRTSLTLLFALTLAACATQTTTLQGPTALATLEGRSGSTATGSVSFREASDGSVTVTIDISGVAPGTHGFHVHSTGDCSAADATSAGPHFDVGGNPHGAPGTAPHHTGDFGNLTADANGRIQTQFTTRSVTVAPGANSVVGKAVILHANADDLTSQPAGNAGARIACGVANLQVNGSTKP